MSAALRYARAAVEAAEAAGGRKAVDELAAGIEGFQAAVSDARELRQVLEHPQLAGERGAILDRVLKKLAASDVAARLVKLFIDADHLLELDELAGEVRRIANEGAGRLRAECKTAAPLTDKQAGRIAKALEKRLGRKVDLAVAVEPELIGGLLIEVGDLTIDSSVRHQLERLRERLESAAH